jgi:hypothetical protein
MKYVTIPLAALFALFGTGANSAQSLKPTTTIDGSKNPELISDACAYRLIFAHFSNLLADETLTDGQRAGLFLKVGLSGDDEAALRDNLKAFKARRDAKIKAFNETNRLNVAAGVAITPYVPDQDPIVQDTRDTLSQKLSTDGSAKLLAFVRAEKKNMRISSLQQ